MPYFNLYSDEDQQKQLDPLMQAFNPGTKAGPVVSSRSSSAPAPSAAPVLSGASPASGTNGVAGDSGSSFVNWDRYQNANRDVSQAGANTVADSVTGTANQAASGLTGLINTFNTNVSNATGHAPPANTQVQDPMGGVVTTTQGRTGSGTPVAPGSMNSSTGMPTGPGGKSSPAAPFSPSTSKTDNAPNAVPAPAAPTPGQPAPGHLTRDDLVAGAGQTYKGPTSLADTPGYDSVTGQITNAASQVNALGSKEGLGGLLAKNFGSGAVGSGDNEFDTALLGQAGRQRFGDIQKGYGDLPSRLDRAGGDAQTLASQARDDTTHAAGSYQGLLDQFDTAQKAQEDAAAAKQAADAAKAAHHPAKSFADYNSDNAAAHTIRDVGRFLNPLAWAINKAGKKWTPEDVATPGYEKQYDHPFGNAEAVQFDREMPGTTPAQQEAVYNSMSDDELAKIEKMNYDDQLQFLMNRLHELGQG